MARAKKTCTHPDCWELTARRYCPDHERQYRRNQDQHRGNPNARGYTRTHRRLRAEWKPRVETGGVTCWRCGTPINPTDSWDLGHDDTDRTRYRGPEHQRCGRATQTPGRHTARPRT